MRFANINSLRELETLLENHPPAASAAMRAPAAPLEYRFSQTIDFGAFARQGALKQSGLH